MITKIREYHFDIQDLIDYLEKTKEEAWITDVVRKDDGRGCVMSHIFDFGGGDKRDESGFTTGGQAWDLFEAIWATTYMIYPVNDGENAKYQQPTPKQRCIAYIKDLRDGKEKNTLQLMEEWEEEVKNKNKTKVCLGKSADIVLIDEAATSKCCDAYITVDCRCSACKEGVR